MYRCLTERFYPGRLYHGLYQIPSEAHCIVALYGSRSRAYDISVSTPPFIRLAQPYVLQHHQQFLGEEQKFDITYGSGGNGHRPIMDSELESSQVDLEDFQWPFI